MRRNCILVVEDNEIAMVLVHDLLRLKGCTVLKAYDAVTAIRLAKTEKPDVIVMDIQLPAMDGLAATRILKADPDTSSIPVIALSRAHRAGGQGTSARSRLRTCFSPSRSTCTFFSTPCRNWSRTPGPRTTDAVRKMMRGGNGRCSGLRPIGLIRFFSA